MTVTRPLTLDDVPALVGLVTRNREYLAPVEPAREEAWFTAAGQETVVRETLDGAARGLVVPRVVLGPGGTVAGRINLNNVVRGAFQSCSMGYWLGEEFTGRGLATAAAGELLAHAFDDLGLHRVEAGTLVDNVASQKVLARNGFERFGLAPRYLRIAGRWQDHVLFQRLSPRER